MKDMVYTIGSQPDADNEKKAKKKSSLSMVTLGAAVLAAMETLAASDLAKIASDLEQTIKNPIIVAAVIAAFTFMNIGGGQE